jgi:hypothetical protein
VVEGVVEGEQGRLVAAVAVARAREAGRDLVGQLAREPQRTGGVEELLELCADVPEARRAAEGQRVRPADVIEGRDLDVGGGVGMCPPRRVRVDRLGRRELGHAAQANLGARLCGALGDSLGEGVDVPGCRVVDDCDVRHGILSSFPVSRRRHRPAPRT